jgi:hypothetical protein
MNTYLIDGGTTFESFEKFEVGDFVEGEIINEHYGKETVRGTIIEVLDEQNY